MRKLTFLLFIVFMASCNIAQYTYDDQRTPYYSEIYGVYLNADAEPIYHPDMYWSTFRGRAIFYYESMGWIVPSYLYLGTPPHFYSNRLPYWYHNKWTYHKSTWNRYHKYNHSLNRNHYYNNRNEVRKYYYHEKKHDRYNNKQNQNRHNPAKKIHGKRQ